MALCSRNAAVALCSSAAAISVISTGWRLEEERRQIEIHQLMLMLILTSTLTSAVDINVDRMLLKETSALSLCSLKYVRFTYVPYVVRTLWKAS